MDRTRCAQNVRRPRAVRPTHSSRPVCATRCARLCVCVSLYLALSASGYLCVRCFRLCVSVCVCVFRALRVCVSLFVRRPPCWASGPSVCRVCLCLRAVLVCACMSGRERQRERKWLRPCLSSPSPSLTLLLVSVGVPAGPLRGTSIKGVGCSTWTGGTTSTSLSSSPSLVLVSLCFPFSLSLSLSCFYMGAPASLLSLPSGSSTAHSGGHVHRNLSLSPSLLPWCVAFRERDEAGGCVGRVAGAGAGLRGGGGRFGRAAVVAIAARSLCLLAQCSTRICGFVLLGELHSAGAGFQKRPGAGFQKRPGAGFQKPRRRGSKSPGGGVPIAG